MYTHSDLITSKHRIPGSLLMYGKKNGSIQIQPSPSFLRYVELDIELETHTLSLFPLPH